MWPSGSRKTTTSTCKLSSAPCQPPLGGGEGTGQRGGPQGLNAPSVSSIADNLPVATRLELYSSRDGDDKKKEKDVQFEHGYRLGFTDVNKVGCLGGPETLWEFHPGSHQLLGPTGKGGIFSSRFITEGRMARASFS